MTPRHPAMAPPSTCSITWASSCARVLTAWAGSTSSRTHTSRSETLVRPLAPPNCCESAAPDLVAAAGHLRRQRLPQSLRHFAGQQFRGRRGGDGGSVCLGDVEHRGGTEADNLLLHRGLAVRVALRLPVRVDDLGLADDRRQHPDGLLAPADLAAQGLPGAVAGDLTGIGSLDEDQDQIVEAVPVQLAAEIEPGLPLLTRLERVDRVPELPMQRLDQRRRISRRFPGGPAPGVAHRSSPAFEGVDPCRLPVQLRLLGRQRGAEIIEADRATAR